MNAKCTLNDFVCDLFDFSGYRFVHLIFKFFVPFVPLWLLVPYPHADQVAADAVEARDFGAGFGGGAFRGFVGHNY